MDFKQYTKLAIRTESVVDEIAIDPVYLRRILSTLIAAGNLLDVVKKDTFYGIPTKPDKALQRLITLDKSNATLGWDANTNVSTGKTKFSNLDTRLVHAIFGIVTESVELLEALISAVDSDGPIDAVNVGEEIADIAWYLAIAVDSGKLNWDKLLEANIQKLRERYPDKFDSDSAINRDVNAERAILEDVIQKEHT